MLSQHLFHSTEKRTCTNHVRHDCIGFFPPQCLFVEQLPSPRYEPTSNTFDIKPRDQSNYWLRPRHLIYFSDPRIGRIFRLLKRVPPIRLSRTDIKLDAFRQPPKIKRRGARQFRSSNPFCNSFWVLKVEDIILTFCLLQLAGAIGFFVVKKMELGWEGAPTPGEF